MGIILLLAMIGVPILEIAMFIEVGGRIGLWSTIAIVILTAVIGTALLRFQGLATLFRASEALQAGQFPMTEVFDGLCLVVAGALLLTPGFFTDAVGFLLFVPPLRAAIRRFLGRYLAESGRVHMTTNTPPAAGPSTIEGEFSDVTSENDDRSP
jgi:UPF0716 protein FxsA